MTAPANKSPFQRLCDVFGVRRAQRISVFSNAVLLERVELWQIQVDRDGPELLVRIAFDGSIKVYKPIVPVGGLETQLRAVEEYRKNGDR